MGWTNFLEALQNSPPALAVATGAYTFPWLESIHVLAVAIVVGTIAIVDLRLLGYWSHRRGARQLTKDVLPYTWCGFVLALITGGGLFISNAPNYWDNKFFVLKMCVLVLAGVNMAIFHLSAYRRIGEWDDALPPPLAARVAGGLSLTFWVLVIIFGRWIGFTMS